jgi:soluble lytic murein transglycosylase
MRLRYPVLYQSNIAPNAAAQNIPSAWILGLMRQESRFTETISSSVGARGLMQIMPATGRWLAKQKGLRDFSTASLNQPAVNIELGSFYMKQLLDEFSGSFVLATAAYNAGPGRPRNWARELTRPIAASFFIEHIPFSETRNYVKAVLSNAACYQSLLEKQPVKLSSWLGSITAQ